MRRPEFTVPIGLSGRFGEMAGLVCSMAEDLGKAFEGPTTEVFQSLARSDQRVDALYEELMELVTGQDWIDGVAPAVELPESAVRDASARS